MPKSKYEDKAIEPAALGRRASRENLPGDPKTEAVNADAVPAPRKSRPSMVDFKAVVEVVDRATQPGEPEPQNEPDPEKKDVEVLALDGGAKPKPERQITTFARTSGDDDDEEDEDEEAAPGVDFDQTVAATTQDKVDAKIAEATKPDEEVIPPLEAEDDEDGGSMPVKRLSKTRERVPTCHFKKGGGTPFNMDDIMDSSDEEIDYADDEAQNAEAQAELGAADAPAEAAAPAEA